MGVFEQRYWQRVSWQGPLSPSCRPRCSPCPPGQGLQAEQSSLPPYIFYPPLCRGWQALPLLPGSAPKQQISPSVAPRQYSLVMPSSAPDKTPARPKHSLRPPDRVACNTNILPKGGRWIQMFHFSCIWQMFCLSVSFLVCIFHFQTFRPCALHAVFYFCFFITLCVRPHPRVHFGAPARSRLYIRVVIRWALYGSTQNPFWITFSHFVKTQPLHCRK